MSIKRLVEQNVFNEATQQWEKGYTPTDARIVETADGSNVQAVLDAIPGRISTAEDNAIAEVRADVAAEGDTLAKLHTLIKGLHTLTASDTETLNTLQEVVDFIKTNRNEIDAIGTNKVDIADVVNNLTTIVTVEGKTLDARQGKVLKDLIDALAGNITTLQTQAEGFVTTQQLTDGMTSATAAAKTVISATAPTNPVEGQVWLKPGGTIEI